MKKFSDFICKNKNIVLNRELILTHLWGYDFDGDDRVVDTHIKTLRKALGEKGSLSGRTTGFDRLRASLPY